MTVDDPGSTEAPEGLAALEEATRLMAAREVELVAKGYPEKLAQRASARAWGVATSRVEDVRPELRSQAFLDTLTAELQFAELWAGQTKRFIDGSAPETGRKEEPE